MPAQTKILTCKHCLLDFANPWQLRQHMAQQHSAPQHKQAKGEKPEGYTCKYCDKHFATRSLIANHYQAWHPDKPRVGNAWAAKEVKESMPVRTPSGLTCPECGFVSKSPQGLGKHRLEVHGVPGISRSTTYAQMSKEKRDAQKERQKAWYYRDKAKKTAAVHTMMLNYCPSCGCNIQSVAAGMTR